MHSCLSIEIGYSDFFLWRLNGQFYGAPHNFSKTSTPQLLIAGCWLQPSWLQAEPSAHHFIIPLFSFFRDERKIEFREVDKLQEIHHKYSVYPHRPGRLCSSSASASVLLYEDRSKHICEVRWLQCEVSPPKASLGMLYFCQVSKIACTANLTVIIARNNSCGR